MKKLFIGMAICFLLAVPAVSAQAGLSDFLSDLNAKAKADIKGFGEKLSNQFSFPLKKVKEIIEKVDSPADAFMCLQLSLMTSHPPEIVVQTYRKNNKKGWGAIAKELGIKPGSDEFHALKNGEFSFTGQQAGNTDKGKIKRKGKGKGKGKSHKK